MKTRTSILALILALTALPLYTALEGQERVRQMDIEEKKLEDAKKREEKKRREASKRAEESRERREKERLLEEEMKREEARIRASRTTKTVGGMEFVYIAGGSFWMGSPEGVGESNERPRHRVEVSGFWMGKFEVTQGQYQALMGTNPSNFKGDSRRPVEEVSWHDAKAFCKKFSAKHGVIARLPTEAEWEYAARAGTSTKYYWGDNIDGRYCWYNGNSNETTHPVGKKLPNAWGLYDMSGNVREWCEDWYDANNYSRSPKKDSKGPASGNDRVLRGGSWNHLDYILRSAFRTVYYPGYINFYNGFRVVLPASGK